MAEVHQDMKMTTMPSWINRAPKNLGTSSHGKLSADHWRTACTINLVITLIRLWGKDSSTDEEKDLLNNFIDVVTVIRWATARCTSEKHVSIVEVHIRRYLDGLVRLFSSAALLPNHHFLLHLPECIRAFGPVHGFWSYPFERFNGIIQRYNTNNKRGGELC